MFSLSLMFLSDIKKKNHEICGVATPTIFWSHYTTFLKHDNLPNQTKNHWTVIILSAEKVLLLCPELQLLFKEKSSFSK